MVICLTLLPYDGSLRALHFPVRPARILSLTDSSEPFARDTLDSVIAL
jgi:hypothetical protein